MPTPPELTQPPRAEVPRGPRPGRERVPLGLGLCLAALALNRWSLGWLLAEDGELTGLASNLLLGMAQAAVFCAGTALLRRRGRVRSERAPAWTALGVLVIGIGLVGSALTVAPFSGSRRLERELELVAALFEAEQLDAQLAAALAELADDLADGRLDGRALAGCAARVRVSDALAVDEPAPASAGGVLARRRFSGGPATWVEAGSVRLLAPVLGATQRLADVRLRPLETEWLPAGTGAPAGARARVELTARLGEARREALTALLELTWTAARAGDGAARPWLLTDLALVAAELARAPGEQFEAAPGPALPAGVRVAGVCLADLDGDGREDLYVTATAGPNLALLERGAGRYEERGRELGLDVAAPSRAAAGADFDHDGRDELLVARDGAPALYLDAGADGRFHSRGALDWPADVSSIALGDVDGDGWLDAFLGVGSEVTAGDLDWRAGGPPAVRESRAGPLSALLRGAAGAGLELVPARDPWALAGHALQAALCDWDGDGDLDLCLVQDLAGARFFENDGRGNFRPLVGDFAPALGPAARAVAFGDHDGDGRPDLFALRAADPGALRALALLGCAPPAVGGALFWNARDGYRRVLGAEAQALERAPDAGRAAFVDLDGDGRLDLCLSGAGSVRDGAWWRRARLGPDGRGLSDPRARAAYLERERRAPRAPAAREEPGGLFLNVDRAGPRFEPLGAPGALERAGAGRILAWLDLDRDGLLEALTASSGVDGDRLTLVRGRLGALPGSGSGVLAIRLEGGARGSAAEGGGWSPRGGHGARIEVTLPGRTGDPGPGGDRRVLRVHRAAELQGGAGGALTLVGLGGARAVPRVLVRWPSGRVQEAFDVPAGAALVFHEDPAGSPTGAAALLGRYRAPATTPLPSGAPAPGAQLQIDAVGTTIEGRGGVRWEPALAGVAAAPPDRSR